MKLSKEERQNTAESCSVLCIDIRIEQKSDIVFVSSPQLYGKCLQNIGSKNIKDFDALMVNIDLVLKDKESLCKLSKNRKKLSKLLVEEYTYASIYNRSALIFNSKTTEDSLKKLTEEKVFSVSFLYDALNLEAWFKNNKNILCYGLKIKPSLRYKLNSDLFNEDYKYDMKFDKIKLILASMNYYLAKKIVNIIAGQETKVIINTEYKNPSCLTLPHSIFIREPEMVVSENKNSFIIFEVDKLFKNSKISNSDQYHLVA